nr:substrate-binding domain-containing protein [Desulfobaculum xiamenense]
MLLILALVLVSALSLPVLAQAQTPVLMMATTTSTDNTGLLDVLAPVFQQETGIELRWTAVGTGKALAMGRNCDVDVLLVHAPAAEKQFVDEGYGVDRTEIMYNDFVIIGPESDPAGVRGRTVVESMKTIAEKKIDFVSRGDNSGTHKKELSLWKAAGMAVPDKAPWYVQTGQGMISTINVAAERNGYTMTDRGTYIKYEATNNGDAPLKIIVEGDKALFNQYSVLCVNPEKCAKVKYDLATRFREWMASAPTQQRIAEFRLLGKQLFTPNAR